MLRSAVQRRPALQDFCRRYFADASGEAGGVSTSFGLAKMVWLLLDPGSFLPHPTPPLARHCQSWSGGKATMAGKQAQAPCGCCEAVACPAHIAHQPLISHLAQVCMHACRKRCTASE